MGNGMMIGVVLWSDPQACKAVFWCEDHGDLAYYAPDLADEPHAGAFTAGDMVQFDIAVQRDYREASNAQLVKQNACKGLQKQLRRTADEVCKLDCAAETSKVIALNFNGKPRSTARRRSS
ncbi:MAG: hypothetical protein HKN30_05405 [Sulfitobacter sp.]|nr:hypothetical protein [Sulfitobacter sp.]